MAGIAADLAKLAAVSRERVKRSEEYGGPKTALEIQNANRLFGQQRYAFEKSFLEITAKTYQSPMELFDFAKESGAATKRINEWVETVTKQKIKNLIPDGALTADTRLVLTNAIYFKGSWAEEFGDTPGQPFYAGGRKEVKVTMLRDTAHFGHLAVPGGDAVTVNYAGGGIQFVLFVPKEKTGLPAMEKALTAGILQKAAQAPGRKISLTFPQFKLEPDRVQLSAHLKEMGMPSAFDSPKGGADFSRMAPRKPEDYLFISEVFHKAFIAVDKYGTEAAAATAVAVALGSAIQPNEPLEIKADRPFLFAIQHEASGACLFMGRVNDPSHK
jgi:serpin B